MKSFILSLSLFLTQPLWALTCYYTLAKDNCWLNYNVAVEVVDASNTQVLTTMTVPAGKAWGRTTFPCQTTGQKLIYRAQFTPSIWESEKGRTYYAKRYWTLPANVNPGDKAWNISACYSADFAEVPMPPGANSQCQCDFKNIPPIVAE